MDTIAQTPVTCLSFWSKCAGRDPHREDVLESGLEEIPELLLRDELEESRLERVIASIIEKLHLQVKQLRCSRQNQERERESK